MYTNILHHITIICDIWQYIDIYWYRLKYTYILVYIVILQYIAIYYNILQYIAIYCNVLPYIAIYYNRFQDDNWPSTRVQNSWAFLILKSCKSLSWNILGVWPPVWTGRLLFESWKTHLIEETSLTWGDLLKMWLAARWERRPPVGFHWQIQAKCVKTNESQLGF